MPMHDGWGAMFGMWIFWLVIIVLAVVALIWLVRTVSSGGGDPRSSQSPEEILKERYARGEIDDHEYQRRLEKLRK